MKDIVGLIPQVFYDVIGRIVPGATILIVGTLLMMENAAPRAISFLSSLKGGTFGIVVVLSILAAYVVGFVFGAIGVASFDDALVRSFSAVRKERPSENIQETDIPFIYDFVLIRDVATGLRLAKLRAESHMCGALVIGCTTLAVVYVIVRWDTLSVDVGLIVAGLIVSARAALFFKGHLRTRAQRLQINSWLILNDASPRT